MHDWQHKRRYRLALNLLTQAHGDTGVVFGVLVRECNDIDEADRLTRAAYQEWLPSQLTERERQVLALYAAGYEYKQIAKLLTISDRTVQWHLGNVNAKLNTHNSRRAVIIALKFGLLSLAAIEL